MKHHIVTIMLVCITTTFIQSVTSFGIGDIHTHIAPFISQPSLLQDSISNLNLVAINNPAAISIFDKYMSTLSDYPLPTKMITGACLATAGDAIAQGREDGEYNPSRGSSFALFDATYRAAQHYVFPIIVELCKGQFLFNTLATIGATQLFDISALTAMERSLASQLIVVPFFYYPVFFTFTAYIQGLDFDDGLKRAKDNFVPLMKRNLLFWIPVQYIQFCYIPTDLQIPFLSVAGLVWTFILSVLAGSAKKYSTEEPEHETYCIIGTEDECVIPDDELFPVAFDDFDENTIGSEAVSLMLPDLQHLDEDEISSSTKEERSRVVLK